MTGTYNGFYFRFKKFVADMTAEELHSEVECAESYFAACRREGQGVSSKEFVRCNTCRGELEKRGRNDLLLDLEEICS